MNNTPHILSLVVPTPTGDAALTVAKDAIDAGGRATVVVHVTDETLDDIRNFARSEDLGLGEAEGIAMARLEAEYGDRLGDRADIHVVYAAPSNDALIRLASEVEATLIAVSPQFTTGRSVHKLTEASHLPVMVMPVRACVAA